MFLVLPYKTELRLGQWPVVTYALIILCLVIHVLQVDNRDEIHVASIKYCDAIYQSDAGKDTLDYLTIDKDICIQDLDELHGVKNIDRLRIIFEKYNKSYKEFPDDKLDDVVDIFSKHMLAFKDVTPNNLDSYLSYDPSTWNPFSMILAGLSHADWPHVIFNLIFFYAFTPALELLTRSPWKFLLSMVIIQLVSNYSYSLSSIFTVYPVPTLGFSGVVSGMIGLAAFLMPWARIKIFIWFFFYLRIFAVPAWFVALWFIGWDTYDLMSTDEHGGINVLVHVLGGFTGYFLGFILFKEQRELNNFELKDEIDFMRSKRQDFFSLVSSYKANNGYWESKQRDYQSKQDEGRRKDILYKYITSGQDSKAITLILDDYHLKAPSIELYEELFFTIKDWRQGRVFYCLGRLLIHDYMQHNHTGAAIRIVRICLNSDADFVLANSADVIPLTKECINFKDEKLAYLIIKNSHFRYHGHVNKKLSQDMELLLETA